MENEIIFQQKINPQHNFIKINPFQDETNKKMENKNENVIKVKEVACINQVKPASDKVQIIRQLPILDYSNSSFSKDLYQTFQKIGFAILRNHPISNQDIQKAFQFSQKFFDSSSEIKSKTIYDVNNRKSRGYIRPGRQIFPDQQAPDRKQVINLGVPYCQQQINYYPNIPGFLQFMGEFSKKVNNLAQQIIKDLQRQLGLTKEQIWEYCQDMRTRTLRLLSYASTTLQELKRPGGKQRIGIHSDEGILTIVFQKPGKYQNGLQALSKENKWINVTPQDYQIVLNIGDNIQHWTNGKLVSTMHRVEVDPQTIQALQTKKIQIAPKRMSIAFFIDADYSSTIKCLPQFGEAKYQDINAGDYKFGRLKDTIIQ